MLGRFPRRRSRPVQATARGARRPPLAACWASSAARVVNMSTMGVEAGCLTDSVRLGVMAGYGNFARHRSLDYQAGFAGGPVLGQAPVWRGSWVEGAARSAVGKECHGHVLERFPLRTPVPVPWRRWPGVTKTAPAASITDSGGWRPRPGRIGLRAERC